MWYVGARSDELQLRASPSTASKIIATVGVSPGQRLSYDDQRYRTIQAGRIEVLSPSRVEGRLIGRVTRLSRADYYSDKFSDVKIEVKPGTRVEYLQYRAEGSCFVRIDGHVINASGCPTIDTSAFKLEAEPITVGNSSGWLLITPANVKEVRREF
jgi:hypothetical protein